MSYTKFEYLSAVTDKNSYDFDKDTCINVTVKVKNAGDRDGKEVVQVYVRDAVSSIVMPVKELKAFKKIFIRAGNSEEITLEIPRSELRLTDNDGFAFYEDGDFIIEVGTASDNIAHTLRIYAGKGKAADTNSCVKNAEKVSHRPVGKSMKVSGMTRDIQSTPVADVKIYSAWSGKELGTTDKDGKFSVTVQSDDTLLFKYKDNNATEVKIEGRRSIAVKLL